MKFFEIFAEVLVPKFTRAEVRLSGSNKSRTFYRLLQTAEGSWSTFKTKDRLLLTRLFRILYRRTSGPIKQKKIIKTSNAP